MLKKDLIVLINEEISEFDFLGNDEYKKETENINLMKNEDFQKQFICDSLLNPSKIRQIKEAEARLGGNWEDDFDDADNVTIEYNVDLGYVFDQTKDPVTFNLSFYSDKIDIKKDGWYDKGRWAGTMPDSIEPSGDAWFNRFDWLDINVGLYSLVGDEIDFIAYKKAPDRIKILFLRVYLEDFVGDKTGMDIRTKEMNDKVQNVPYC